MIERIIRFVVAEEARNLDAAALRVLLHLTMGLGTKNRLTQNAALCREHL